MASEISKVVSRNIEDPQRRGASRPYRVRYRISWPDDVKERLAANPDQEPFTLERIDCDQDDNPKVDDTTHHPNKVAAQAAADADCGHELDWTAEAGEEEEEET